jgi:2,4-dienoyl-CoA reductase-like NADH-dependent reductase (Old Yellow Enzyme family)
MAEASAVSPEGRITPGDACIWADRHIEPVARINRFLKEHGAVPGNLHLILDGHLTA